MAHNADSETTIAIVPKGRQVDESDSGPRKRRARYALRACDECKRRKGRCDGYMPCQYCESRSLECYYDADLPLFSESSTQAVINSYPMHRSREEKQEKQEKQEKLSDLVEHMRAQIDELLGIIKKQNQPQQLSELIACRCQNRGPQDPGLAVSSSQYHGASSSDYSLNVVSFSLAGIKSSRPSADASTTSARVLPFFNEDQRDLHDKCRLDGNNKTGGRALHRRACFCPECTQSLRRLRKSEALRLARLYEEVAGSFHPLLDYKCLVSQVEALYNCIEGRQRFGPKDGSQITQNAFDTISIALAIALSADRIENAGLGSIIFDSVKDNIRTIATSSAQGLQEIIILLLSAIYHAFNDELRLAWRTCGIAGRMAMELGLHRQDTRFHMLQDKREQTQLINTLWNIVVLDRQWSCAAGLPQNFQDSDFAKSLPDPVEAPYLMAMSSYASFGTRVWDVTTHMVISDAREDEDTFEWSNFQIEQWRKKSLTGLSFVHPFDRGAAAGDVPPQTLPTLLYLRASQLRGLMMRSYLLSSSTLAKEEKFIRAGLEIACDIIDVLFDLDATTDIYRIHHETFQHFLASSVALLFLLIANESKKHPNSTILNDAGVLSTTSTSVRRAFGLATVYASATSASCRLWKRMTSIAKLLPDSVTMCRGKSTSEISALIPIRYPTSITSGRSQPQSCNGQAATQTHEYSRNTQPATQNALGSRMNACRMDTAFDLWGNDSIDNCFGNEMDLLGENQLELDDRVWRDLTTLLAEDK
ncbi:hypothetical protein GQ53DRAFT_737400 [Thozetella sp. PMI_491]|nr:hypothetical protein GQ53DRAFT_737400 [Thozetella sp. PMI_491]